MKKPALMLLAAILVPSAACAGSGIKTFFNPSYGGSPVDFCLYWSKSCGRPAADRFCHDRGLEGAVRFTRRPSLRTRLQGSGEICTGPTCASFRSITCYEHGL